MHAIISEFTVYDIGRTTNTLSSFMTTTTINLLHINSFFSMTSKGG